MFIQASPKAAGAGGASFIQAAFASEWLFSPEGRSLSTDLKDALLKAKSLLCFPFSWGPDQSTKHQVLTHLFLTLIPSYILFFIYPPKPVLISFNIHLCCSVVAKIVPALDLEKLKPKRLEVIFYIHIYVVTATDCFSPDSSSLVCFGRRISVCDIMAFACFCQYCCLSRRVWCCFGFLCCCLQPTTSVRDREHCFIQLSEGKIVTQCYRPISPFYSRKCHLK